MKESMAIHWFRQDLRLADNPALTKAAEYGNVLPIYILDDENAQEYAMGGASRWWLNQSLSALNASLGGKLSIYKGNPLEVIADIMDRFDVKALYWNRCYEPWRIDRDAKIKDYFKIRDMEVQSCNGSLLWEPWDIKKNDHTPYKVFTPFYNKGCLQAEPPRKPLLAPQNVAYLRDELKSMRIDQLNLLGRRDWYKKMSPHWPMGEKGAHDRLEQFLFEGLSHYKEGRNFPAKPYVSRLSPYLHFGEVSPNQLWQTVQSVGQDTQSDHFCKELGWREFSYSQLYYHPELPRKNLQAKFDAFPWSQNESALVAWQRGQTGVPMVDAGMRELWQTGYMHNRVRMIVGSFLVKNLRLHWTHGERWFWDTLVDADLANNSASWQWIAGCGADAAPYFRIFNPVTQGQKFDPKGAYVRNFIPELSKLEDKYLFSPWEAPEHVLENSGVILGVTYPNPIVDLKKSRAHALKAFQSVKQGLI